VSEKDISITTQQNKLIALFYRFPIPALLLLFVLGVAGIFTYANYQQSQLIKIFSTQEEQLYQNFAQNSLNLPGHHAHELLTASIFNATEASLLHTLLILTCSLGIYLLIIIFVIRKLKNNSIQLQDFVKRLQGMNLELQTEMQKRDQMAHQLETLNTEFKYQSLHDALTKLANRRLFEDRLNNVIQASKRNKLKFAVMFLDLDHFKIINDSLGHDIGDELLKVVSAYFVSHVRAMDTVARLGGDEFAFILTEIDKPESALVVADRILNSLATPIKIKNHSLQVGASIGITIYPNDSDSEQMLLKNADIAMYSAKNSGRGNIQFYREEMNVSSRRELTLRNSFASALQNSELQMFYQPIVDIKQHAIVYFEALIRWNHPQLGYIPPLEIIELATRLGLYNKLENWIIYTVCTQIENWKKVDFNVPRVCINISPKQLESAQYAAQLEEFLAKNNFNASSLILEITESLPINNMEQAKETLNKLIKLGIKIASDDFGTSYSSLNYLRTLPFHIIKIDRSFTQELANSSNERQITQAIINLAKNLNLEVIAEGVETKEQLNTLTSLGCSLIQGYLFSQPIPAENCLHIAIPAKD